MEFIEAKINHNSILKMLSKRSRKRPPKVMKNPHKKGRNRETAHPRAGTPGTAVLGHGCMAVRPVARPCFRLFCACCPPFCSSWCQGFLDPLIFLEITFEVLFSIET